MASTVDELERPEGNDLQSNYEIHDVAQRDIIKSLVVRGFDVEKWGIDERDHDGNELIFDNKMDLRVWDGDELVACVEVKSKSREDLLGKFNLRHYGHYQDIKFTLNRDRSAGDADVPVLVYMTVVDDDEVAHDGIFIPLHEYDGWYPIRNVFKWPDGNSGVEIKEECFHTWSYFENEILQ